MTSERGFTLLELLVVLTVMALLIAVAAPRLGTGAGRMGERQLVAKLHGALIEARAAAIRDGRTVTVRVADLDPRAASADAVRFFADGSSSGGDVLIGGRPALAIVWLTGEVRDAR